jgi:RNA polymerase sigma-70 factor (ECF subfamily)
MESAEQLSRHFDENRQRLTALAYRILGNSADAEDAVQDAWVRLSRPGATDVAAVTDLDGWMTTVVSRTCLNKLRARTARPESPTDATGPELHVRPDQALRSGRRQKRPCGRWGLRRKCSRDRCP